MIKKILVAQDGSAHGASALSYGVWLAKRLGAAIAGIHVIDVVLLEGPFLHDISGAIGFEPFLNFSAKMREVLTDRGNAILASFSETCAEASVKSETILSTGIISNEICDKLRVHDLLIIGKKGVNASFERGMLGAATESVVRKSPRPVLIVPEKFSEPARPLLAYDGSPNAGAAMHSAAELVKALSLPLTVITVSREGDEGKLIQEAEGYLKPYGVDARYANIAGEPPSGIERYYKENGHDLLFMGTSHHSRIVGMVLGSTTEHVMRNVNGPFFLHR